jgi:hypothetical protein
MCRSRWLQFTVEQIPYLWPTQGIVTPVSDTSEFALDWFGDDNASVCRIPDREEGAYFWTCDACV